MSISFTKAYVANGKTYATLEQAQVAEIEAILREHSGNNQSVPLEIAAKTIVAIAGRIVDVLTTKDSSRPKARGVKKPRNKAAAQPELEIVKAKSA